MKVQFINRAKKRFPKAFATTFLKRLRLELKRKDLWPKKNDQKTLFVALVSEQEIKALNQRYRQKNKATDVLSFSAIEEQSLGELALCATVLEAQARAHGWSYRSEVCYMLLHGVLHLLGYDHEHGGREAKRMYDLQDALVERLLR